MNNILFWVLAASVIIVPTIGFGILFYIKHINKKILAKSHDQSIIKKNKVFILPEYVEFYKESFWTTDEINFLLNTVSINNFSNAAVLGKTSAFELLVLANQLKINAYAFEKDLVDPYKEYIENTILFPNKLFLLNQNQIPKLDFIVLKNIPEADFNNNFDLAWKNLRALGIIIIINIPKKVKKEFYEYLKLTGIRFEERKTENNSILLITK
ncbi:hypothetical protein NV226_02835 [Mycoplasma iguanae]|uniref:Uncharacterized protein n=1 Tax=Mycoplasma iguanae TaxID=292461 RepID=A0ABY5R7Z7_9MOLU|nr:hypothetical protein [Mycoplasma iguanae]UVD81636.1 hypothetical protein NV226_02835 [Mycoplasma iguanae]